MQKMNMTVKNYHVTGHVTKIIYFLLFVIKWTYGPKLWLILIKIDSDEEYDNYKVSRDQNETF